MALERRSGKDRRGNPERRVKLSKSWIMTIRLLEKRSGLNRRSGLDRRYSLSSEYHHEALVQINRKGIIQRWDPLKAKMTYFWETGLKAIAFANVPKGTAVEIAVNTPQGPLVLPARVLRVQKIFTERGFATEMNVQFIDLDEQKKARINQILWGD